LVDSGRLLRRQLAVQAILALIYVLSHEEDHGRATAAPVVIFVPVVFRRWSAVEGVLLILRAHPSNSLLRFTFFLAFFVD
jgi:hypothetical protein